MQSQQEVTSLPLAEITIQEGFNPRRHRTERGMNELTDSIRQLGIIEPIVVRPAHMTANSDATGYYIVAGERRYRAAHAAELDSAPAIVRHLDDDEAVAVAAAENGKREDMSVAEEARLAERVVYANQGDRDEAARMLGWKRSRLDGRMMLMHADEKVLEALEQRQISVGHAELLASVPPVTQRGTLEKIIADGITVADLKGKMGQFTRELAHARFDTSRCQGCPFNSSTQSSLFEFTVGEGRCSNHECWTQKNQEHIKKVRAEQQETYPSVYLDSERGTDRHTILFAEGNDGVGAEQYNACQKCQYYGALVSTQPGREGAVQEGVCFNLTCHAAMVKANKEANDEARGGNSAAGQATGQAGAVTGTTSTGGSSGKPATTGKSGGSSKGKKTQPKAPASTPKAVLRQADAFVRKQAVREYKQDSGVSDALALYALFQLAETSGNEHVEQALKACGGANASVASPELFTGLMNASDDQRKAAWQILNMHLLAQKEGSQFTHDWQGIAKAVCKANQPDLTRTFCMNADYLKAHTKSGMAALLRDAGFAAWYDECNGEGEFNKLIKKKVKEIVAAAFPEDADTEAYNFAGFVPDEIYKQSGVSPITQSQEEAGHVE